MLALAFLTLFGVSSVALVSLTGVSSRNSKVARTQVGQLFAADGGIETFIRTLQTEPEPGVLDPGQPGPSGDPRGHLAFRTWWSTSASR